MTNVQRQSPVGFESQAVKTEDRNGWPVVLEYEDEGEGPFLVDLSHRQRWDVQDSDPQAIQPVGLTVPETPGACTFANGILINRMNRTQVAVWHLTDASETMPAESAYTDVTEATLFLALLGPDTFSIAEKLTAVDFFGQGKETPFLLQGPFSHVPCQLRVTS